MHIDEKQKFPKCKQQKWWWENWIFEHYIWLKRSKILANQLFFSFFYIKSAVRFLIAWSWIHPGRNPMLDTCPPRQCLTRSVFEINPSRWVSIQISYVIIFIFWGPLFDMLRLSPDRYLSLGTCYTVSDSLVGISQFCARIRHRIRLSTC